MATVKAFSSPTTLLPTPGILISNFRKLATVIPEQRLLGNNVCADNALASIQALIDTPSAQLPLYSTINVPEIEMEKAAIALTQDYKVYVQFKILEEINNVMPLSFDLPIPYLGGNVSNFIADPSSYKTLALNAIRGGLTLPAPFNTNFSGSFNLNVPDFQAQELLSIIMNMLQNSYVTLLETTCGLLVSTFSAIWTPFGFAALPALTIPDMDTIISGMEAGAGGDISALIASLKAYTIPGTSASLSTILGFDSTEFVVSSEMELSRLKHCAKDFAMKAPMFIIESWLDTVMTFLSAIGLSLPFIPFSFTDYLTIAVPGFPPDLTSICGVDVSGSMTDAGWAGSVL